MSVYAYETRLPACETRGKRERGGVRSTESESTNGTQAFMKGEGITSLKPSSVTPLKNVLLAAPPGGQTLQRMLPIKNEERKNSSRPATVFIFNKRRNYFEGHVPLIAETAEYNALVHR